MENLLVVVAIIYFVASVFGRSNKKKSANQDKYSIEPSESIENSVNMDIQKDEYGYFSGIEEYFDVKPEKKNTKEEVVLVKTFKEKEVDAFDNKTQHMGDTYKDEFIIKKKESKKKLNLSQKALKNAIVMSEILGKPVSMK